MVLRSEFATWLFELGKSDNDLERSRWHRDRPDLALQINGRPQDDVRKLSDEDSAQGPHPAECQVTELRYGGGRGVVAPAVDGEDVGEELARAHARLRGEKEMRLEEEEDEEVQVGQEAGEGQEKGAAKVGGWQEKYYKGGAEVLDLTSDS